MQKIQSIPQPVIAEVQGIATAAGCQLVATCDLAVAAEEAAFATPGVKIGLFCTTPMVALTRAIGRKRALQMLLTGEMVDARTAADWGLINQVVPAAELAGRHPAAGRERSPRPARWWSPSASRPSTRRSISTSPRPTPTPKKSCR